METVKTTKTMLFSSKWYNQNKRDYIEFVLDYSLHLKNKISRFIRRNLKSLLEDEYNFKFNYKLFCVKNKKQRVLSNHTIQTLFNDISILYKNMLRSIKLRNDITTLHTLVLNKSYRKYIRIQGLSNYLVKASNYQQITHGDILSILNNTKTSTAKSYLEFYKSLSEPWKKLILTVINSRVRKINRLLKTIEFKSGTIRLTSCDTLYKFIEDNENTLYKRWLKLHFPNKEVYLPLQVNFKYHDFEKKFAKQITIIDHRIRSKNKILQFAIAYDHELAYLDEGYIVGIDVNLTPGKFMVGSDGTSFSYDDPKIKHAMELLNQYLKIGLKNLTHTQQRRLRNALQSLRGIITEKITEVLKYYRSMGYSEIVMEDLDNFSRNYVRVNILGVTMKMNTFLRFLHIAGLKQTVRKIAANLGMKVHFVPAQYTSQQCSVCGNIDPDNRKNQKDFRCTNCGTYSDADKTAAFNILMRFLMLRDKICSKSREWKVLFDAKKYLRKSQIKNMLISSFKDTEDVLRLNSHRFVVACSCGVYTDSNRYKRSELITQ